MLIPQFSIRWIMGATAVLAVVSYILSLALGGSAWAAGVVIALASAVVIALVHALVFLLTWAASNAIAARRKGKASPDTATGGGPARPVKPMPTITSGPTEIAGQI